MMHAAFTEQVLPKYSDVKEEVFLAAQKAKRKKEKKSRKESCPAPAAEVLEESEQHKEAESEDLAGCSHWWGSADAWEDVFGKQARKEERQRAHWSVHTHSCKDQAPVSHPHKLTSF